MYNQSYGFSSSYVQMWQLDPKDSWVLKNWWFQLVVLEKTLESPLDCREIKPVHPKGNQPKYSLEGLMLKLKFQYFGHLIWRQPIGKDPDAGKDWRQEDKEITENKIIGYHHRFSGHEFEQPPGDNEGQGSLECCNSWGCKESDMTEQMNNKFVC